MNSLVYLMFLSVFLLDYLSELQLIPRQGTWLPEILSAVAFAAIVLRIGARSSVAIHPKYVLFFLISVLVIVAGIVLNSVHAGAIFAGLRTYGRYLPFFFLPLVYDFSDKQMSRQLLCLLGLGLLQFPVTIYQRFFQFHGSKTGDVVAGTIGDSGQLSIVLICFISVWLAFALKKRISFKVFLAILPFLFIPVTINETTASFFLLPLAFLVPMLFLESGRQKLIYLVPIAVLMAASFVGLLTIYDRLYHRWGDGGAQTILYGDKLLSYLYRGADKDSRDDESEVGRLDSVVLPFTILSSDLTKLTLGLGIGNTSESFSDKLEGGYMDTYDRLGPDKTTFSQLLWEVGLLGAALSVLLLVFVFQDAVLLRHRADVVGAISLGLTGVIAILALSMMYKNLITPGTIGYPMWYFFGYVASKRVRMGASEASAPLRQHALGQEMQGLHRTGR